MTITDIRTATAAAAHDLDLAGNQVTATSTPQPRVSVIIPTRNEAKNLPHVFNRLPKGLHEVILVDGHSTDDTAVYTAPTAAGTSTADDVWAVDSAGSSGLPTPDGLLDYGCGRYNSLTSPAVATGANNSWRGDFNVQGALKQTRSPQVGTSCDTEVVVPTSVVFAAAKAAHG